MTSSDLLISCMALGKSPFSFCTLKYVPDVIKGKEITYGKFFCYFMYLRTPESDNHVDRNYLIFYSTLFLFFLSVVLSLGESDLFINFSFKDIRNVH